MSTTWVIQWAIGPVGSVQLAEVIDDPNLTRRGVRLLARQSRGIQCALKACLGMVSGRSTELSSPDSAATT
jgi:hypothetical protein